MSGEELISALERVGCENVKRFTGQSFTWMYDHEPLVPFFDWFCSELHQTNVLTLTELEQSV